VNWAENATGLGEVRCWQGICIIKAGQILVALKRNGEYALHIKSGAARPNFGQSEMKGA